MLPQVHLFWHCTMVLKRKLPCCWPGSCSLFHQRCLACSWTWLAGVSDLDVLGNVGNWGSDSKIWSWSWVLDPLQGQSLGFPVLGLETQGFPILTDSFSNTGSSGMTGSLHASFQSEVSLLSSGVDMTVGPLWPTNHTHSHTLCVGLKLKVASKFLCDQSTKLWLGVWIIPFLTVSHWRTYWAVWKHLVGHWNRWNFDPIQQRIPNVGAFW